MVIKKIFIFLFLVKSAYSMNDNELKQFLTIGVDTQSLKTIIDEHKDDKQYLDTLRNQLLKEKNNKNKSLHFTPYTIWERNYNHLLDQKTYCEEIIKSEQDKANDGGRIFDLEDKTVQMPLQNGYNIPQTPPTIAPPPIELYKVFIQETQKQLEILNPEMEIHQQFLNPLEDVLNYLNTL